MEERVKLHLKNLLARYPILYTQKENIVSAFHLLQTVYNNKGKLLCAGNGGSAADSEHIVGELMKGFLLPRHLDSNQKQIFVDTDEFYGHILSENLQQGLPAISLVSGVALHTAFANDVDGSCGFAQQVYGLGTDNDAFLGISTSGNSENIIKGAVAAKSKGLKVIGLSGFTGGKLKQFTDICICVPATHIVEIQELHLPIYHCLCAMLEAHFFG